MSKIPVQFELNDKYVPLVGERYIPPIAHEPEEAERRQTQPRGTLIFEQQLIGTVAARLAVQKLVESGSPEDLKFMADVLGPASLGTSWYSLRGGDPTMRRHLVLPPVAVTNSDERLDETEKSLATLGSIEMAEYLADKVLEAKLTMGRVSLALSHAYGHAIGDAGLWIAMLPHGEIGSTGTAAEVQQRVLKVGMDVLDTTVELTGKIGETPSIAMLGEEHNNLTTYIRKKGSHDTYHAFRNAQAEAREIVENAV